MKANLELYQKSWWQWNMVQTWSRTGDWNDWRLQILFIEREFSRWFQIAKINHYQRVKWVVINPCQPEQCISWERYWRWPEILLVFPYIFFWWLTKNACFLWYKMFSFILVFWRQILICKLGFTEHNLSAITFTTCKKNNKLCLQNTFFHRFFVVKRWG